MVGRCYGPVVVVVGLTGGIGSGKSTVSALLAQRGAVIIDADVIAREVVAPGGPAYQGVVDRFGAGILLPDGTIDRPALAEIVFNDPAALAELNRLTHPVVGAVIAERMGAHAETEAVVVLDVPLLVESGRDNVAALIVVDCPEGVALDRLVRLRGMDPEDARRRMAAQASRDERRARADIVIDNSGDLASLEAQVDEAWTRIQALR